MTKVELRKSARVFEAEALNFVIRSGETKPLPNSCLKSHIVKAALFKGHLRIVEGEIVLSYKHSKILFKEKDHIAWGREFGKFFKKDLETDEIFWVDDDRVTNEVKSKLDETFKIPEEPEEPEEPEKDNTQEEEGETKEVELPDFSKMKKDELLDWAAENGFADEVNYKDTNNVLRKKLKELTTQ